MKEVLHTGTLRALLAVLGTVLGACSSGTSEPEGDSDALGARELERPSILLITMDTTRADRVALGSADGSTPHLTALGERGVRFAQAYSTVPATLPAHTSMLTGLYPTGHGIRENGRRVGGELESLPALLRGQGYTTAAFVSGFPLASQFGLARGFDHYDDEFGGDRIERRAGETTDRALAFLGTVPLFEEKRDCPLFVWVHFFDPHEPYEAPEPYRSQYVDDPYLGEIAYMDQELGRLAAGFEERFQSEPWKIIMVGDHGEGLGEHGEALHGNLLYQGVMRVPLIVTGSDIASEEIGTAVSVRQIFATVLGWAGADSSGGLFEETNEPVLAEALKPYLQYGWQPQFMAVYDGIKVIRSGETEVYDLRTDPEETENLADRIELDPRLGQAITSYAAEALAAEDPESDDLGQETREKLASLGYIASGTRPELREGAPSPKDMVHLYRDLDIGAGLFIRQEYELAIPVFARIFDADPGNFVVALRLAVAHSVVGNQRQAMDYFEQAKTIDPLSVDLRHYQAMHHLRYRQWDLARPLFEAVLSEMPDRLPALEGLVQIYTRQGRIEDGARLLERIVRIKDSPGLELARLGELRMARGDTDGAIRAFEKAREILGDQFTDNLELGVLYLANRQPAEAALSLDKVSNLHPGYPMALFKRAQVSVLLAESDRVERVRLAWANADEATRPLIENEQLFRDISFRPDPP